MLYRGVAGWVTPRKARLPTVRRWRSSRGSPLASSPENSLSPVQSSARTLPHGSQLSLNLMLPYDHRVVRLAHGGDRDSRAARPACGDIASQMQHAPGTHRCERTPGDSSSAIWESACRRWRHQTSSTLAKRPSGTPAQLLSLTDTLAWCDKPGGGGAAASRRLLFPQPRRGRVSSFVSALHTHTTSKVAARRYKLMLV